MLKYGSAHCELDLMSSGKRSGFVDVSHSNNALAFSSIRVPIGVIKGGDGPTALLTSGNHGDEYEGQIILQSLFSKLTPDDVNGRIIFMPSLNTPAVQARARVSPLDGGNMNRSFPGGENEGPTRVIAGFVSTHLLPQVKLVLDFHSGGTATKYVNCAFLCLGPSPELNKTNIALAEAFGAPYTMVHKIDGSGGDFDTEANKQGAPFLSCELGGMGTFSSSAHDYGWQGTMRILSGKGILSPDTLVDLGGTESAQKTVFIDVNGGSEWITASRHGLAHMHLELCREVEADVLAADMYDIHNFGAPAEQLSVTRSGIVAIRRRNPLVEPGDHLYRICGVLKREELFL